VIDFHYHLVSIIAVFLALGIGILMGTTVVNDVTLDTLRQQIKDANKSVDGVQKENSLLRHDLGREREFFDEAAPALLDGRLQGVPVLVVAPHGIDDRPLDDLRAAFETSSARYEGTLWLTDRLTLDDDEDREDLARLLRVGDVEGDAVHARLAQALAASLLARPGSRRTLISDLIGEGFIDYEKSADAPDPTALPVVGTRLAVLGGTGGDVPDETVVRPLVAAMARDGTVPVVVATAGPRPDDDQEQRAAATALVQSVRDDDLLADRVATVDNLADFAGQSAVVMALEDLGVGTVGHYGVGDGADGLIPPETP
jgi:copper transport outer membrane protein MctB